MNTEIGKIAAEVGRHRRTIYLNAPRVKEAYINSGGVDQLGAIRSAEHGVQLGLPAWLATISVNIKRNRQYIETLQIGDHPGLMASLLEANYTVSQEVLKLSLERAPHIEQDHDEPASHEPVLLKFSGPSFLTSLGESLFTDRNKSKLRPVLPDAVIEKVELKRSGQEWELRQLRTSDNMVTVWIAAGVNAPTGMAYASIAAQKFLTDFYITIMREPQPISMGILGALESANDKVVFILPMWIWQEI